LGRCQKADSRLARAADLLAGQPEPKGDDVVYIQSNIIQLIEDLKVLCTIVSRPFTLAKQHLGEVFDLLFNADIALGKVANYIG
jgi:hypothetical protein